MRSLSVTLVVIALVAPASAAPPPEAVELFAGKCASCHSVGGGPRVGPDLKGVGVKRDAAWLRKMIQTPSSMLDSDPDARTLLAQYNNVRMPDLGLSDAQVTQLVDLLAQCSAAPCDLAGKLRPVTQATPCLGSAL